MLKEQRDIYLKLADEALRNLKNNGITLDDFKDASYLEVAYIQVGEHFYTLKMSVNCWEGLTPPALLLEGLIELDEQLLIMACVGVEVKGEIDLDALIKDFKAEVESKYENRRM